MGFDDIAKRMEARGDARANMDDLPPPQSKVTALLGLWGGMLLMVATGLGAAFAAMAGERLYFKLALVGVAGSIALMVWGGRHRADESPRSEIH